MKDDTLMVHAGREPERHSGVVNPPVYHASTILYPTLDAFSRRSEGDAKYRGVRYGAYGNPTTFTLADTVAELEGGAGSVMTATGLAAVTLALTAFVAQGDHVLMVDSVYGPTRQFCDTVLKRFGVETTYYDPLMGGDIANLIRANTRLIFTESPGSLTFEVQDIPAIAAAAHQREVLVLMDNTWGTPIFFKPFDHGVDVSIQAGTKYISGHSDVVIGMITARSETLFRRKRYHYGVWRSARSGRLLSRPAGIAVDGHAFTTATGGRVAGRQVAAGATGSQTRALSPPAGGPRTRDVETRLHRRVQFVRSRAPHR